LYNHIKIITFIIAILHLFIVLDLDMQWLQIINQDNLYFNITNTVNLAKNINRYYIFVLVFILNTSLFFLNKEKNNNDRFFYGFMLIYTLIIIQEPLQYFLNINNYNFKIGSAILILIFSALLVFVHELIICFSTFRTDEEFLKSGFSRIPNTIQILKLSYSIVISILLLIILLIYYLLLTPINNILLLLLFAIFLFGLYKIIIVIKKNYAIRKYIGIYGYDDGYLKLREKLPVIPIEILDQHEYNYSMIGLVNKPSTKIKENHIFEIINKIHDNKKINFHKLEDIVKSNKININDRNGVGWTPLMKYVADVSLSNQNNTNKHNKNDDFKVLNILLNSGADININNFMIRSPLNFAINYGDFAMVKFLVENNADIIKKINMPDIPIVENDHIKEALELREIAIYEYLKKESTNETI